MILWKLGCRGRRHHQNPWRRAPAGRAALMLLALWRPRRRARVACGAGPAASAPPSPTRRLRSASRPRAAPRRPGSSPRAAASPAAPRRRPGGHRGHGRRRRHVLCLGGAAMAAARADEPLLARSCSLAVASGRRCRWLPSRAAQRLLSLDSQGLLLWRVWSGAASERFCDSLYSLRRGPRTRSEHVMMPRVDLRRAR